MKDKSVSSLSDFVIHTKYAKYKEKEQRRETWEEICARNETMHIKKYPKLKDEIKKVYKDFVLPKKVLMSMRSAQFAGKPIDVTPSRIFNCAYLPIDDYRSFSEVMFLLLGGTGVGYSVQKNHVEKLPEIRKPLKKRRFLVGDSIEGWSDAVKALIKAYMMNKSLPDFDFSDIRPKGARLVTSGGKAPGPGPLKTCLFNIKQILDSKEDGSKLTTLEVHDIVCYIADAVLAGGIRRAALISLFSLDDLEMLTCKSGNWWELNPQRARANNSAVVVRHKITKDKFYKLWARVKESGSGEPGIYFSNNFDLGTNPCCEISLKPFQFCNLTEINADNVKNQKDLEERAKAAAFIGTLQAGYTNLHYLRDIWRKTTEKDALLGVSMTGIASGNVLGLDLVKASEKVKEENLRISKLININTASRLTCIKPAGTTSLVLGSSSGVHAWYASYYIRTMRVGKNEAIYKYLVENHKDLLEDDYFNPTTQAVFSFPIKAPKNAIFRDESVFELLERIKKFNQEWVKPGHIKGDNTNNVSATISIKEDEWENVGEWLWENRSTYNGLSVLPYDGGTYKQAPFQEIDEKTYKKLYNKLKTLDLTKVKEIEDNTDLKNEVACSGGKCEIF